jgi:hypothetical protein
MNVCPICNGDRNKSPGVIKAALEQAGVRTYSTDPGGIAITLNNGHLFRVRGECTNCDEIVILRETRK